MRRRRLLIIIALLTIAGSAWMTPYDFTGNSATVTALDLKACFYWNAVVTRSCGSSRSGFAVSLGGAKKRGKREP